VTPDAVTRTLLEEAAVTIGDIMTTTVVSIAPETPYPEIVERLLESGVSGVPVLDGSSRLVGIVTEADLVSKAAYRKDRGRMLALLVDSLAAPRWLDKAFGQVAADVMTKDVAVCRPDDDVRTVARRLLERGVKRMPVVDGDRVVGIVSRQDILRELARDEV
jgi:CBS domain-containing protein